MQCSNNLKQIGLAIHNYESTTKSIPPLRNRDDIPNVVDDWNTQTISWRARLLPYMEQSAVYEQIDFGLPAFWSNTFRPNTTFDVAAPTVIPTYRCPTDPGNGTSVWRALDGTQVSGAPSSRDYGATNYHACIGPDSILRDRESSVSSSSNADFRSAIPGRITSFAMCSTGCPTQCALPKASSDFGCTV